jgi:FKBP-type peptidyl-prolyl cis-trans isomerase (trigger factor)
MTAKWEKLEGNSCVLTVEVSAEKVSEGLDEAFKKVVLDDKNIFKDFDFPDWFKK